MGDPVMLESKVERDFWTALFLQCDEARTTNEAAEACDRAVIALRARSVGLVDRGDRTYTVDAVIEAIDSAIATVLPNAVDTRRTCARLAALAAIKVIEGRDTKAVR